MALSIGDEILEGKYVILDIIGEGAFGKVYRARDQYLDTDVAIKQLKREDLTGDEYAGFLNRFKREARIGRELRHDNVVHVSTLEKVGDDYYLIMDYIDGPSLSERLGNEGPLPTEEAVEIAIQLCDGLTAIHDHPLGIVHRDIKPSNILLTSQAQPKITDFGLAQLHGESLRSLGKGARHPGTPAYMSPEQERSVGYLRPASDIYSLGCVIFETLTGKVYKRAGVEGTEPSRWRADVLSWLDAVLAKMLASEWQSRFQLAGEVESELQHGLAEELHRRTEADSCVEQAEETLDDQEYHKAAQLCLQALQLVPGHTAAEELLARVEEEELRARKRREEADRLYRQAALEVSADNYQTALDKLKELKEHDPDYGDPKGLEAVAKKGLRDKEIDTVVERAKQRWKASKSKDRGGDGDRQPPPDADSLPRRIAKRAFWYAILFLCWVGFRAAIEWGSAREMSTPTSARTPTPSATFQVMAIWTSTHFALPTSTPSPTATLTATAYTTRTPSVTLSPTASRTSTLTPTLTPLAAPPRDPTAGAIPEHAFAYVRDSLQAFPNCGTVSFTGEVRGLGGEAMDGKTVRLRFADLVVYKTTGVGDSPGGWGFAPLSPSMYHSPFTFSIDIVTSESNPIQMSDTVTIDFIGCDVAGQFQNIIFKQVR